MKLFAQHGAQEGTKITDALDRNLLDGVIYSPKDVSPVRLAEKLEDLSKRYPHIERLFDPQLYVSLIAGPESRLGCLEDQYDDYFHSMRRRDLEQESAVLKNIETVLKYQKELDLTAIIAPNILIPRSFNSIEAVIAKNFIRASAPTYKKLKDKRPIYASLIVGRDALADKQELKEFLNDITLLENRPDGFYVCVAFRSSDVRSDIYNPDTIAAWLLLNHSLTLNGYQVINGYSDLLSPLLCAAGGVAGATGWWSNLRFFSQDRFGPASGGRLPVQRYLSVGLLNRITFFELNQLRQIVPGVLNGLPSDDLYSEADNSEPQRNQEVIQSWESIETIIASLDGRNMKVNLNRCLEMIGNASNLYAQVEQRMRTPLDLKSNKDHLEGMREGIKLFSQLAEIDLAKK